MALQETLRIELPEERGRWSTEGNIPHRLNGVGEDDLLIRVPLLLVVTAVVNELHLLEDGGLCG